MSNGNVERLIYYIGQLLTKKDFEDQQNYHLQKLEQLTQRFPNGIVRGLKVIFTTNPDDGSEALKILEGLAIDTDGKAIVVPNEGILVPLPNGLEKPFLSLKYNESKSRRSISLLEPAKPFDRIVETVVPIWGKNANISDEGEACITVAKLRAKTEADKTLSPEILGSNYVIEGADDPNIRLDASLIGTDQIKNKAVTKEKLDDDIEAKPIGDAGGDLDGSTYPNPVIKEGAINSDKIEKAVANDPTKGIQSVNIANKAVTKEKLADDLEATPIGDAGGDLDGSTYPNPVIKEGAINSDKIEKAVANDPTKGIQSVNIAKGAVNSNKLALVQDATVASHNNTTVESPAIFDLTLKLTELFDIKPLSIGGPISWELQVKQIEDANTITYTITVSNNNTDPLSPAVTFKVIKIDLGDIIS